MLSQRIAYIEAVNARDAADDARLTAYHAYLDACDVYARAVDTRNATALALSTVKENKGDTK